MFRELCQEVLHADQAVSPVQHGSRLSVILCRTFMIYLCNVLSAVAAAVQTWGCTLHRECLHNGKTACVFQSLGTELGEEWIGDLLVC